MSPRHFYNYSRNDPKGYKAFSDNLHNSFVAFTNVISLRKFFSISLPFLSQMKSAERCDLVAIKSGPIDVWNNPDDSGNGSIFIAVPPTSDKAALRADHEIDYDADPETDPAIIEEVWGGNKKDTKPLHRDLYK
jgi:hypothetical protein